MKLLFNLTVLALLLIFTPPASAILMSDAGGIDDIIAGGNPTNDSPEQELVFIAGVLGVDISTLTYSQLPGSGGGSWLTVDGYTNLVAFDFEPYNPEYFMIKVGSGVQLGGTEYSYILYDNLDSRQYGVVDFDAFTRSHGRLEIGLISHVGYTGGESVPEPGTLLLLGYGLIGLGVYGKKFKK